AVLVADLKPAAASLLAGTLATRLDGAAPAPGGRRRIVLLPANVVPQASWLERLREMPIEPDRLHVDGAVAILETARPERVVALAARAGSAHEALAPRSAGVPGRKRRRGRGGVVLRRA